MGRFRMMVRGFVPTPDTTPDAFSFTDLTGQTEGASVTGDPVTITGINASTSFTVTGGTVQINGAGSFVSSGSVVNNDTLTPKGTANATYLGTTDVVVTVGGVSDTFTITTRADPASYSLGVIAAGLQAVVAQKTNGTCGNNAPVTVTHANSPSYMTGKGATLDFAGDPSFYFTTSATIDNFDFTAGVRKVCVDGDGITVTFNNCKFAATSSVEINRRPGGNTGVYKNSIAVMNNCDVSVAKIILAEGEFEANHTLFHDTTESQYIIAGSPTYGCKLRLYDSVMTMSTGIPTSGSHLEFLQIGQGSDMNSSYTAARCLFDIEDTVGTAYSGGSGWSGVNSSGVPNTLTDCVFKGVKQVNDIYGRVSNSFNYNTGYAPTLTNCVLGLGNEGRCHRSEPPPGSDVPSAAGLVYDYDTGSLCNPVN